MPKTPSPVQPLGISAELADARQQLRDAAPPDRWDGVMAEVRRLQNEQKMPPLDAMRTVLKRLALGWVPPAG